MKLTINLLTCIVILSCNSNSQKSGIIVVSALKDSCYNLQDTITKKPIEAFRELEIIQNTLDDTIGLGFAILQPGYSGKFRYLRGNENQNGAYDPEISDEYLPKTKTICVDLYQRRPAKGKLVIKYSY